MKIVVLSEPYSPTQMATPSWLSPIANCPQTNIVFIPRHLPSKGAIRQPTNWKMPTRADPVPGLIEKPPLVPESSLNCWKRVVE